MDDSKKFLKDHPGIKLNEWVEEEIDIPSFKPELDEVNKRVKLVKTTEKATQRTFYSNSPSRKMVCDSHKYKLLDKHKYIFKCVNCDWHYRANPANVDFDPATGRLFFRDSGDDVK